MDKLLMVCFLITWVLMFHRIWKNSDGTVFGKVELSLFSFFGGLVLSLAIFLAVTIIFILVIYLFS